MVNSGDDNVAADKCAQLSWPCEKWDPDIGRSRGAVAKTLALQLAKDTA